MVLMLIGFIVGFILCYVINNCDCKNENDKCNPIRYSNNNIEYCTKPNYERPPKIVKKKDCRYDDE